MLNPLWLALSLFAVVSGVLVILTPKVVTALNDQLNKALATLDKLILRYRHWVGALLFVVAYLCFRLALILAATS